MCAKMDTHTTSSTTRELSKTVADNLALLEVSATVDPAGAAAGNGGSAPAAFPAPGGAAGGAGTMEGKDAGEGDEGEGGEGEGGDPGERKATRGRCDELEPR